MSLGEAFSKEEHNQIIIDCFLQMWRYSADLMFIMAVEEGGEFSLYDNNPASKEVMGIEKDTNIHRLNMRAQFGDEMADQIYATYHQVLQEKKPVSIEQEGIRGDGSLIYFDTLFVPIFDALENPLFVCGVSRDITKIKEAEAIALEANEKLLEYSAALETINQELDCKVKERTKELEEAKRIAEGALEAKSSFVARMSHEIRTPINAVIGLSHLSLKTTLNDDQKDYIQSILASGENLLTLVNDVLDFSKIEAGKMQLEEVSFSPKSIVQHAMNMGAIKAEEKKLSITIDISPSMPKKLLGDPFRIQQIVVNLVTNAIKFTSRGGICVRMYTEENGADSVWLRCDVIDTGIGVSKVHLDQLFQSFQQADDSITRQFGGTGLGLTISRQLCELMGGEIWAHSTVGQGSTFSFSLPIGVDSSPNFLQASVLSAQGLVERNREESIPDFSNYCVLLVEDNVINQKVVLGYLNDTQIKISVANNGEEAIKKLEAGQYDLILLDIQMPVMDGLTAAKKIRQSSVYGQIPIIAMTAHVSESAKQQSAEAGMNEHLDKPILKPELYQVLQKYLLKTPLDASGSNLPLYNQRESLDSDLLSKLSSIELLAFDTALSKLGGKYSLYLDLLSSFYQKYKDFSLSDSTEPDLVRAIHSLKSNSAYIGALRISSLCEELESKLSEGDRDLESKRHLLEMVETLIKSMGMVLPTYLLANKAIGDAGNQNGSDLLNELRRVEPLLNKSDFFVENHFSLLRKSAKGTQYALDIEDLISDVNNIEFEVAVKRASQLILQLQGD